MNFETLKNVAVGKVAGASQFQRLSDVGQPFIGAMVNEAYHKIERAAMWKFSEANTTLTISKGSQTPSSPPTDMSLPLMARNINTRKDLEFHDERQRFHYDDDPDGRTGRIIAYGIWGGTLRFFPTASKEETIALRYYKRWTDLEDDSDEPIFPATWHDLLTDYAAAKIALRLPAVDGKYLPESASRPFMESWMTNLQAMVSSDLVLTTWDAVQNHDIMESMWMGEGRDW